METIKKLEQEVKYQDNHLQQAFTMVEKYFDIVLEKEHKEVIKVVVMKTILLAEVQQDLNHAKLQLADKEMQIFARRYD